MDKKELIIYQTDTEKEPLNEWLDSIKDEKSRVRILSRLDRVEQGHYGDYASVGSGVYELRYFFGSGYRLYFAEDGDTIVLLLCGGDKGSQKRDVKKAHEYWHTYQEEKKKVEEND